MAPEPVLIMMAHLTAYKNVHGGGFKNFGKSASPEELLIRTLSTVLVHGPVFLEGIRSALLRVVLLHDVETLASNSSFQGVELRYSARGSVSICARSTRDRATPAPFHHFSGAPDADGGSPCGVR